MEYRRDIDGLRAIAVGSVVLFHAGVPGFGGGFVGVDIFFVISGFLISGIILEKCRTNSFTFLDFYDRRIRRILPALFAVYAVCFIVGILIALPSDLKDFGKSLTNSAFFFSNHYFYQKAGYFDTPSIMKPLLHSWSLSVEEQFYVLWPIALLLLWRIKVAWARLAIVTITAAISLGYAQWELAQDNQPAAFYLLTARAWELLIGALLALTIARISINGTTANLLAAAGLGLIGLAIFTFSPEQDFPGVNALLPCLGAALLILAGHRQEPALTAFLRIGPMVFLGLISYSLYLWHWPILSYWQLALNRAPSLGEAGGLIIFSVLLATLSYFFIEKPFRSRRHAADVIKPRQQRTVRAGFAATAVFALAGLSLSLPEGWPQRFGPDITSIFDAAAQGTRADGCEKADAVEQGFADCMLGLAQAGKPVDLLLIGDSHGRHYSPGFDELLQQRGLAGQLLSKGGCRPLPGERERCIRFSKEIQKALTGPRTPPIVAFAYRWDFTEGHWSTEKTLSEDTSPHVKETRQAFIEMFEPMIADLTKRGRQVILVGQIPPYHIEPQRCLARARAAGRPDESCFGDAAKIGDRLDFANRLFRDLAARYPGVYAFLPSNQLCDKERCSLLAEGVFLYKDDNHLNRIGARTFTDDIAALPPFRSKRADRSDTALRANR